MISPTLANASALAESLTWRTSTFTSSVIVVTLLVFRVFSTDRPTPTNLEESAGMLTIDASIGVQLAL